MNESRPWNNGEKHNDFPLVRRPSSAVERAAPGAKRILSGMVSDTLALAKKELPRKSRPLRIVMVNDEPSILQIFEIVIRDWFKDATMLFFDNGATALEELVQTDPDLLITDDRMAVMSGGELCHHLLDRKVTYPIIAVSCVGLSEQWVREFANRGLNVSLLDGPPFDPESFLKAVETALNIKRVAIEKPNKLTSQAERRYNEFKSGVPETRTHNEDVETIFKRGLNYSRGEGVPQDYAEAAKWFRKAAEMGFARAQSVLGVCYGNGVGVPKDEIESFKWCQKAAEQDFAEAQDNLGRCYEHGHGVQQNFAEAIKWYRKAAENGEKNAQYKLGRCLDDGTGVPKNIVEAYKWYHKAAEQGLPEAQFMSGHCLMTGEGVTPDIAEGAKWYRKSAEQEFSPAQINLAMCYRHGQGVPKNLTEAAQWYRKAAEQRDAEAQFSLGDFYRRGEGVPQDYTEAANWYRKAAEQGVFAAQNNLGVCYEKGLGVPKDQAEADKWFRKAAEQKSL
ncbi:MAG: response regulator [Verrucomicrobiia bacterium]